MTVCAPRGAPSVGERISRYALVEILGAGDHGVVYRAVVDGRPVALKWIWPIARGDARPLVARLRAAAALAHPNVAPVFEVAERDGAVFVARELAPHGVSDAPPRGADRSVRWLADAARALAAAHRRGIVHGGLSIANLLVGESGEVKISDFGVCAADGDPAADRRAWEDLVEGVVGRASPVLAQELRARVRDVARLDEAASALTAPFAWDEAADGGRQSGERPSSRWVTRGGDGTPPGGGTSGGDGIPVGDGAPRAPNDATAEARFAPGERVAGRYAIERFVARGGMGEVYAAYDLELRERVALKMLASHVAGSRAVARLRRELALARRVTHPGVCRVFDLAVDPRAGIVLTMELLEGETLAQCLARGGPLEPDEALPIARALAEALDAAHVAGVVHRDFKPQNVILVPGESGRRAVVTDFGIARLRGDGDRVTLSRARLGTPAYMAPEQVEGDSASTATDVYAFGVVLYEMTTGALPFEGANSLEIAAKRLTSPPRSPRELRPELPERWARAILRCLEREPGDRFQRCGDVLDAIEARPRSARWRAVGALGAIVLGAIALGSLALSVSALRSSARGTLGAAGIGVPVALAAHPHASAARVPSDVLQREVDEVVSLSLTSDAPSRVVLSSSWMTYAKGWTRGDSVLLLQDDHGSRHVTVTDAEGTVLLTRGFGMVPLAPFNADAAALESSAILPDGDLLAWRTCNLSRYAVATERDEPVGHEGLRCNARIRCSRTGCVARIAGGSIARWSPGSGVGATVDETRRGPFDLSADGRTLVVGEKTSPAGDRRIMFVDMNGSAAPVSVPLAGFASIQNVAVAPDGAFAIVTATARGADEEIDLVEVSPKGENRVLARDRSHRPTSVAIAPDGRTALFSRKRGPDDQRDE